MSLSEANRNKPDIALNFRTIINDLVADGRLSVKDADQLSLKTRTKDQLKWHPLELIAEELMQDQKKPSAALDLETLTLWLCEKSKQPYHRIDPLKIDSQIITKVMSHEFAKRHGLLALEVKDDEVIIASAEPSVSSWEATISQSQPGKVVTRVISNPAMIRQYTTEFYTMARSVSQANALGLNNNSLSNLEQMLELGQLETMEANDEHVINIVDWLLGYAFTQRARLKKGGPVAAFIWSEFTPF